MKRTLTIVTIFTLMIFIGIGVLTYAQEQQLKVDTLNSHQDTIQTQTFECGSKAQLTYDQELFDHTGGELDIDTSTVSEGEVELELFHKEFKASHTYRYPYAVVDTQMPTLVGLEDLTMTLPDIKRVQVSASDPVDGDLDVIADTTVDYNTVGTTTVNVYALDSNGNKVEGSYTVTIKAKPQPKAPEPQNQPKPQSTNPQSTKPQSQPKPQEAPVEAPTKRNMITLSQSGDTIPYEHKGMSQGQRYIDQNPKQATTWEIIGSISHSNTDGSPTYFAGHVHQAFKNLHKQSVGTIITVHDGTGHAQDYRVTHKYYMDIVPSSTKPGAYHAANEDDFIPIYDTIGKEAIVIQTCEMGKVGSSNLVVVAVPV